MIINRLHYVIVQSSKCLKALMDDSNVIINIINWIVFVFCCSKIRCHTG